MKMRYFFHAGFVFAYEYHEQYPIKIGMKEIEETEAIKLAEELAKKKT